MSDSLKNYIVIQTCLDSSSSVNKVIFTKMTPVVCALMFRQLHLLLVHLKIRAETFVTVVPIVLESYITASRACDWLITSNNDRS